MNWLPPHSDFRSALREIRGLTDPGERVTRLATLARHRLDLAETLQLDKALTATAAATAPGLAPLRLALLSTSTVDHLAIGIRVAGLRQGLRIETQIGQFGQYRQEIFDPSSPLYAFAPQALLLSLTAHDLIRAVPLTATAAEAEAAIGQPIMATNWG